MIRLGSQIRLTQKEIEYFRWLTDIEPAGIRTRADLDAYVAKCKAHIACQDTQFLHWMIDREAALPGGVSLPQEIGPLACPWGEAPHSPSHAARGKGYMAQPVA